MVVDDDEILMFDKAESNPLQINGHSYVPLPIRSSNVSSAFGAIYTISNQHVRPLNLVTNSFCAAGGWLGNGTMYSLGGNPNEGWQGTVAGDGLMGMRLFTPCPGGNVRTPSPCRADGAVWDLREPGTGASDEQEMVRLDCETPRRLGARSGRNDWRRVQQRARCRQPDVRVRPWSVDAS